jgi:hypothetical protein
LSNLSLPLGEAEQTLSELFAGDREQSILFAPVPRLSVPVNRKKSAGGGHLDEIACIWADLVYDRTPGESSKLSSAFKIFHCAPR